MKNKQIAILGAGPSGLVAGKEAIERNLDIVIFEKEEDIGGVWHHSSGAVWGSMRTNLSKYTCSFSDFPWPQNTDMFPSSDEMLKYLKAYSVNYNLLPHIQFKSTVVKVEQVEGQAQWLVRWINKDQSTIEKTFDGVIVATGIFATPYIPDIDGLKEFSGNIIHSKDYKDANAFKNSKVLVVGGGFSGAEIASDVANETNTVIHNFHEPFWLLKRFIPKSPSETEGIKFPLDLVFYNRKSYGKPTNTDPIAKNKTKNMYMDSLCKDQRSIPQLNISEEDFTKPIKITISDEYVNKVKLNQIIPQKGTITKFIGSKVIYQDGDEQIIDSVIFATGFRVNTTFLSENILKTLLYSPNDQIQPLILYNATLHPDLLNMFFVGMYKGPYFAVMEQQAKWACKVFSGEITLPPQEQILKGLETELKIRQQNPRPQFPHSEYVAFADEIAEKAKSFPDIKKLQSENYSFAEAIGKEAGSFPRLEARKAEICAKFMTSPVIPAHYNLCDKPYEAIEEFDIVIDIIGNTQHI